jgi:hypothetical protein
MTNIGTAVCPTGIIACSCLDEAGILHIRGPEIYASDLVSVFVSGQIGGYAFGPSFRPEISISWISLMVTIVAVASIACLLFGGGKLIVGEIDNKAN